MLHGMLGGYNHPPVQEGSYPSKVAFLGLLHQSISKRMAVGHRPRQRNPQKELKEYKNKKPNKDG